MTCAFLTTLLRYRYVDLGQTQLWRQAVLLCLDYKTRGREHPTPLGSPSSAGEQSQGELTVLKLFILHLKVAAVHFDVSGKPV